MLVSYRYGVKEKIFIKIFKLNVGPGAGAPLSRPVPGAAGAKFSGGQPARSRQLPFRTRGGRGSSSHARVKAPKNRKSPGRKT